MSVELSFPATASGDASVLAHQLRTELADGGVPIQSIKLARTSPENMDLGTMLTILQVGLEGIAAAHASYDVASIILNFAQRTRSVVKIKSPDGNIEIRTNSADASRLSEILKKFAEPHHDDAS